MTQLVTPSTGACYKEDNTCQGVATKQACGISSPINYRLFAPPVRTCASVGSFKIVTSRDYSEIGIHTAVGLLRTDWEQQVALAQTDSANRCMLALTNAYRANEYPYLDPHYPAEICPGTTPEMVETPQITDQWREDHLGVRIPQLTAPAAGARWYQRSACSMVVRCHQPAVAPVPATPPTVQNAAPVLSQPPSQVVSFPIPLGVSMPPVFISMTPDAIQGMGLPSYSLPIGTPFPSLGNTAAHPPAAPSIPSPTVPNPTGTPLPNITSPTPSTTPPPAYINPNVQPLPGQMPVPIPVFDNPYGNPLQPVFPPPKPTAPAQPKPCFICTYQDFPACASSNANEQTCPNIRNEAAICVWRNGACIGGDKALCDTKVADARRAGKTAPDPIMNRPPRLSDVPAGCTSVEFFNISHSNESMARPFVNRIRACVVPGSGVPVTAIHAGCRTFQNQEEVIAYVRELQRLYGGTYTVTANQALSTCNASYTEMVCTSYMTITVTPKSVTVTYDRCSSLDNCVDADAGQIIRCTGFLGNPRDAICCGAGFQLGGGYTHRWRLGRVCGNSGFSNGVGIRYWCSDSAADAQSEVNEHLASQRSVCERSGMIFVPGPCTQGQDNGLINCVTVRSCRWVCWPPIPF